MKLGTVLGRSRDDGFILPTVLWVLSLLSLVVLAIGAAQRLDVRAQANLIKSEQARLLVDGMARAAASRLATDNPGAFGRSGTWFECSEGRTNYAIMVTDVAGLVDLNASPLDDFSVVLRGLGLEPQRAIALAHEIIDARDADDTTLSGEHEGAAYSRAGLSFGPKNLPFESTAELDQLPGMSPDILTRLEPLVTVHSRRPAIDQRLAPEELRQILERGQDRRGVIAPIVEPEARSRVQEIRVLVETADGARAARHLVVEMDVRSNKGFRLNEWRSLPNPARRPTRGDDIGSSCFGVAP